MAASKRRARRPVERLGPGHIRLTLAPSYAPSSVSERVLPLLASSASLLFAAGLHVALFYGAAALTHDVAEKVREPEAVLELVAVELNKPPAPKPKPIEPTPEPEPAPLVEEVPIEESAELEPAAPEPPPPQKPELLTKPKPKEADKAEPPKAVDPWADAADFGAFEGSTSAGGSIAVSTGSSAAGRLQSGGQQREAKPAPAPKPVVADESGEGQTESKPKVVSRKKLSKEASPNESYNRRIKASYPAAMKAAAVEADVVAVITIGADGSVLDVRVVNKVDASFADAAIEAFKKFRFEPAIENGKTVASELRLRYRFRLDEA